NVKEAAQLYEEHPRSKSLAEQRASGLPVPRRPARPEEDVEAEAAEWIRGAQSVTSGPLKLRAQSMAAH
ncbi:hypothetical protein LTR28_001135, partial [Elasticomyces elasticus]